LLFEDGLLDESMYILAELKKITRQPQGTDFLRAKCFLKLGKKFEATARECIKEEIRINPNHKEAKLLYDELFPSVDLRAYSDYPEFQEIASKISFHTIMPM
jgi:hypothetical protein